MQIKPIHSFYLFLIFILCTPLLLTAQKHDQPILKHLHFSTDSHFEQSEFLKVTGIKPGLPVQLTNLRDHFQSYEDYLYNQGFLFARIDSAQMQFSMDSSKVDLKLFGWRGELVRIGKFEITSDSLVEQQYLAEIDPLQNRSYSQKLLDETIQRILTSAADRGFLFAEVEPDKPSIYKKQNKMYTDVLLNVHEHERAFIRDIRISGNSFTKPEVLLRELPISAGSPYDSQHLKKIPERLMRLGVLKNVKEPEVYRVKHDSISVKVEVEEGNATTFDGVIGYIPDSRTGNGYLTGLIDISFKNLFGSGRKFFVHWKKPDALSEEFALAYKEPWVLNYPVDLGVQLERTVRDTTFMQWSYALDARLRLFQDFSLIAKFQRHIYYPDSISSRDFRLVRNQVFNTEIGMEYDTRDYPLNPRSGLYYSSSYSYGLKTNWGPSYILEQDSLKKNQDLQGLQMGLEFYYNLWSNQVLAFKMSGMQAKGSRLQLTDYYWFGGSRSLRGYRENQFRGSQVGYSNLEYRYLMGRNTRLFLFSDFGYYRYKEAGDYIEDFLIGYGMGVRLETPLGVLGVDFGLANGESFREAKIHFGIINQF